MSLLLLVGYAPPAPPPPPPPPVVVATPAVTAYSTLVAQVDQTALLLLGGEPVIYQPAIGAPVTVSGIFDDSYLLALGDEPAGIETRVPTVFLLLADLPTNPITDDPVLTIGGVAYRVFEHRPSDFGSIVLALRKVV